MLRVIHCMKESCMEWLNQEAMAVLIFWDGNNLQYKEHDLCLPKQVIYSLFMIYYLIQDFYKTKFLLVFIYFLIYLLIMLLQLSHFCPFTQLHPAHPPPSHISPYSSCPWVILISSLASPFPILFLPSPCLFTTYHLCCLFFVPFPPLSPSQSPIDNLPCELHFCGSVPVLVVCLVFFCFCFRCSC